MACGDACEEMLVGRGIAEASFDAPSRRVRVEGSLPPRLHRHRRCRRCSLEVLCVHSVRRALIEKKRCQLIEALTG